MRLIDTIVVHCSDSPHGRGDDIEAVRRWHTDPKPQGRGWTQVGYHAVIPESGEIQYGRPDWKQGAHVRGHNNHTIGVCLIGRDVFTPEQFDALERYIREKRAEHGEELDVMGHCELDPHKTCPNFDVQAFEDERGL